MPVTDFECQIARGQIGRYLGGGMLSTEAMAGLEAHVAECAGCKALVAERRAELLESLGGEAPTRAVVELPVENPLIAALRAKAEAEIVRATPRPEPASKPAPRYAKASPKGNLGKPLALAALLAVVLVGMSRLSHTATAPAARADASFAAETLPTSIPKKVEKPKAAVPVVGGKGVEASKTKVTPVQASLALHPLSPLPRKGEGTPAAPWHQVGTPNPDVAEATTKGASQAPKPSSKNFLQRRKGAKAAAGGVRGATIERKATPVNRARPTPDMTNRLSARAQRHPSATARRANLRSRKVRVTKAVRKHLRAKPRKAITRTSVRVYGLDGRPLKP